MTFVALGASLRSSYKYFHFFFFVMVMFHKCPRLLIKLECFSFCSSIWNGGMIPLVGSETRLIFGLSSRSFESAPPPTADPSSHQSYSYFCHTTLDCTDSIQRNCCQGMRGPILRIKIPSIYGQHSY